MKFRLLFLMLFLSSLCTAQETTRFIGLENISISASMKLQILLDRAGYSPGEIDGRPGTNTRKALEAFQKLNGLKPTGRPDPATLKSLEDRQERPFLTYYTISSHDIAWPFSRKIPKDLLEQSRLEMLQYTSILELIAERFHVNPAVLRKMNPKSRFLEGNQIIVPNVTPMLDFPIPRTEIGPIQITVFVNEAALTVKDETGKTIMFAPITTANVKAPLPIGTWKVNGIDEYPFFHYDPKLMVKPNPKHKEGGVLPPGPNNPVGVVWIDVNVEHVGMHGTSEPSKIGYQTSNGCIRLTNWDAARLASMARPGTPVEFVK